MVEHSASQILSDEDFARHAGETDFLAGIAVSQIRFSENGFDWQLIRYENVAKPDGPLWVVPHDDEDAAYEAMVDAIRDHGGVGIAVNTQPPGSRRQSGQGRCGVRPGINGTCDPNRNFDDRSPMFTQTILREWKAGRPVIALHTNGEGFSGDGRGGRGDITMLDARAYRDGIRKSRPDGYLGNGKFSALDDPDVYAILPYRAVSGISPAEAACRSALNGSGINVWHERVGLSDGSLSNYIALNRPEIAYVNFEAKREADLSIGAAAQRQMINAYLEQCGDLWNQPVAVPDAGR